MANTAIGVTNYLTEPGFLYWAPLGSTTPANTVLASKYTDTWPAAWVPLGGTDTGTEFSWVVTTSKIEIAESYLPIAYRTTNQEGHFGFALAGVTAGNLTKAFNGAINTVTGTGPTLSTQLNPVTPGNEVRAMIGWESMDSTTRIVAFQVFNSGDVKLDARRAPQKMTIPWMAMFEQPTSGIPWRIDTTR